MVVLVRGGSYLQSKGSILAGEGSYLQSKGSILVRERKASWRISGEIGILAWSDVQPKYRSS